MPTAVLDAGVEALRFLAEHRTPLLDVFFGLVTDLGSSVGYLVLLPLLWWGVSWKLALRLFVAIVLSVYLNALLKDTFAVERPFVYADVSALRAPDDYSFPSGHAQTAFVFWGFLALHIRRRWFSAAASLLIVLIGFSRLYLGVHFPSDVAAGWVTGGLLLAVYVPLSRGLIGRAASLPLAPQLGLAMAAPLALTILHPTRENAVALGGLAGALAGLTFARHRGLYREGAAQKSRRAWLAVGLLGLPIVYFTMRAFAPSETTASGQIYLWLRYAAIGLWVSFLVPRIVALVRARGRQLAEPEAPSVER